jgi:phosphatidylglycerophosphate synthase
MTAQNRRPLKTRSAKWAGAMARGLGAIGLTPNAISTIGIGFAALGAWCFVNAPQNDWLMLGAALCIQLRLLANMLDGMVAVEGGKQSATGPLYNEVPDRIEDALLLIGAGYACGEPLLGYGATILAFGTAYIRANGGALGLAQDFSGPMAKQHRMFVLTVGAVAAFFLGARGAEQVLVVTLGVITIGALLTCVRRTWRQAQALKAAEQGDAA